MVKETPFSQSNLNKIFKLSSTKEDRITSRENSWLEFKESFGWKSMALYLKSCAAFANNKGGYIVFGVAERPNRLVGLNKGSLSSFKSIDPQRITNHLNQYFAPKIKWDMMVHELNNKSFGLLYTYESENKPVICTRNNNSTIKEGDIFYRYRGRSERIKYSELREIIDKNKSKEKELWMSYLQTIAKVGVQNVGIFDLSTGDATGPVGTYLIEESLLSQLSFIKEGEFSETKGKPAIKIVGTATPTQRNNGILGKERIVKTKGIRTSDIIIDFLCEKQIKSPEEYIKQICFERSAFLPIYYFIYKAKISITEAVEILHNVITRSRTKNKIIERLEKNSTLFVPLSNSNNRSSKKKKNYVKIILKKDIPNDLNELDLRFFFQAVRALKKEQLQEHSLYIRKFLRKSFNKYYASADSNFADNLRRAIAWVDEALYSEKKQ